MKYLNSKTAMLSLILSAVIMAFTIIACQKNQHSEAIDTVFDSADAKEWYYGTFKKSQEWSNYNAKENGIKSPDWKHSTSQKIGNLEIVEFPLIKVKTKLLMSSATAPNVAKRVAESALTRIAFIKENNQIRVREIDYVPSPEYAASRNYDISR